MSGSIDGLVSRLRSARRAIAFTGAGISTESGIPDFRSPGGVWTRYPTVYYDEFMSNAAARAQYWRMKRELYADCRDCKPNAGHAALARLEAAGRLQAVITQNIDGLHQDAGSQKVLELHGTGRWVECTQCDRRWPAEVIFEAKGSEDSAPLCSACRGFLKPATVMFGQAMPLDVMEEAQELSLQADVFLAIGSSLTVEPAASLPRVARHCGAFLAIINRDPTPLDDLADAVIRRPIGETLASIPQF
jgi:NAD-dependent protein deacetylase/lipoamidase